MTQILGSWYYGNKIFRYNEKKTAKKRKMLKTKENNKNKVKLPLRSTEENNTK